MADATSAVAEKQRVFDGNLIAALLLSAVILLPRGAWMIAAHSTTTDENYHLSRGLMFLRDDMGMLHEEPLNDPPLGEALVAVPAWLNHVHMYNPLQSPDPNLDPPPPVERQFVLPDRIRQETAVWKVLLFLPAIALVFQWVRSIYSTASAWLAVAMILSEPTIAAHLPLATLDILGMEGILFACWAIWRFIVRPTTATQFTAAATVAIALLLKNTALILPMVAVVLAIVHWIGKLRLDRDPALLRRRFAQFLLAAAAVPTIIWVLLRFDVSLVAFGKPFLGYTGFSEFLRTHALPDGIYLKSVYSGMVHNHRGHPAFLLGQTSLFGWWYYFPVVALYKIPVGFAIVFFLSAASLFLVRPRYEELPLLICALTWTASLMLEHIDIGFRHFLPAEIFWLMLASRAVAVPWRFPMLIAWAAVAAAFVDISLWLPDDLSYVNFPHRDVWLDISDSNLDWGQGLRQIRAWMNTVSPQVPIYVAYSGPFDQDLREQLGPRATGYATRHGWMIRDPDGRDIYTPQMPQHGLLVIGPIKLANPGHDDNRFEFLKSADAIIVIGHALPVFDLDRPQAR
jgi:hypothetical protein